MKTQYAFLIIVLITFCNISCKKVITPALHNTASQLVIEGIINDTSGPYQVTISNSVNFYNDNIYRGISGAQVSITDNTSGITDKLTETSAGVYSTHTITGIPGHIYLLSVIANGKSYTASSMMPQPVLLDSISFDKSDTTQIRPVIYFQDPVNVSNNYEFTMRVNNTLLKSFEVFNDLLSDGKYIRRTLDVDTFSIKKGDIVNVSLSCVDHNVYNFLKEAQDVAYSNDNLAAPSTPTSNISGGCIGYFSAETVRSKTRVAK